MRFYLFPWTLICNPLASNKRGERTWNLLCSSIFSKLLEFLLRFHVYMFCYFKACMVQPKAEMDLQFESTKLSTPWGYFSAIVLCVTTFGTIALTSGFFLKPDATIDDYLADVVPLFAGFITILGVSEVCCSVPFY